MLGAFWEYFGTWAGWQKTYKNLRKTYVFWYFGVLEEVAEALFLAMLAPRWHFSGILGALVGHVGAKMANKTGKMANMRGKMGARRRKWKRKGIRSTRVGGARAP